MTSKKEKEDLLDIKAEVSFLETFIKAAEGWAEEAHIDEAYELEAPCRAAVHHTRNILNLFLSARNQMADRLDVKKLSAKDSEKDLTLTIVN